MFIGGYFFKFIGSLVMWIYKGFKIPFENIWNVNRTDDLADDMAYEFKLKIIGLIVFIVTAIVLGSITFSV